MNKSLMIIFLSMASIGFNTFSYAAKPNPKTKVEVKKKISQVKKTPVPEVKKPETFDFRKIRWGMNRSQIVASEKSQPLLEIDEKLTYKETMFERDVSINYFFEDSKVIKSEYLFDGSFVNATDYLVYYQKIKKNLISKYGKPNIDESKELDELPFEQYKHIAELIYRGEQDYNTIWEKPRTTIRLALKGKDFFTSVKLFVTYNSKKFKEIDTVKEVEKSLF